MTCLAEGSFIDAGGAQASRRRRGFTLAEGSAKETAFDNRSAEISVGKKYPPKIRRRRPAAMVSKRARAPVRAGPSTGRNEHATGLILGTRSLRRRPRQRANADTDGWDRREGHARRRRRAGGAALSGGALGAFANHGNCNLTAGQCSLAWHPFDNTVGSVGISANYYPGGPLFYRSSGSTSVVVTSTD